MNYWFSLLELNQKLTKEKRNRNQPTVAWWVNVHQYRWQRRCAGISFLFRWLEVCSVLPILYHRCCNHLQHYLASSEIFEKSKWKELKRKRLLKLGFAECNSLTPHYNTTLMGTTWSKDYKLFSNSHRVLAGELDDSSGGRILAAVVRLASPCSN